MMSWAADRPTDWHKRNSRQLSVLFRPVLLYGNQEAFRTGRTPVNATPKFDVSDCGDQILTLGAG
jgi:hypothetical protein